MAPLPPTETGASPPRADTEQPTEITALPDAAAVIAMVLARGERVETVEAELVLDLKRADGAEARLAGALRMARPDRFRVRSTKWGFLVCDVVVRGEAAHAVLSPVVREQAQSSAEATVALSRVLGSMVGWSSAKSSTTFTLVEQRPTEIVVRLASNSPIEVEWTLARSDGRTLMVRRIEQGEATGVLTCSDHVEVDGVPLPRHLRFESAMGRIDVEVKKPRVNAGMALDAFEPPSGALPVESLAPKVHNP